MKPKLILTYILAFLLSSFTYGKIKSVGVPKIQNFLKREYGGATQSWAVAKDSRGFMYFANNDGLLEYDGNNWKTYQLPANILVRSLFIDDNDDIYVGLGFNDFGVFRRNKIGNLEYHSFRHLVEKSIKDFSDIWKIHKTKWGIVFQSFEYIHIYNNESVKTIHAPFQFHFSFYLNSRFFIQDRKEGLMELINGKLQKLTGTRILNDTEVWFILPFEAKRILIGTRDKGSFIFDGKELTPWENETNELLKKNKIYSSAALEGGNYAFGTILDGLLIANSSGDVLQHVDKKKGLQNNTILSLNTDKKGNLWLGLDNGIDYVHINSPFTFLHQPDGLGSVYTTIIYQGKLYIGTNRGLYVKNWPEQNILSTEGFKLIPNTDGQVWHLGVYDDILLCGHTDGTFQIEGSTARQISTELGGWSYFISNQDDDCLIAGNYNGLTLFKKDQTGRWKYSHKIEGFIESCRTMVQKNDGSIWMAHGYKGIYDIRLNDKMDSVVQYTYYTVEDGLPRNEGVGVYEVENQTVFSTGDGIYTFDPNSKRFEKSKYFSDLFGESQNISFISQDDNDNIWYVANSSPGVLRFQENGTYLNISNPFKRLRGRVIGGFEYIYIPDNENVFLCLEDGLEHYSPLYRFEGVNDYKCFIRQVFNLNKDSVMSFSGNRGMDIPELAYRSNALHFSYSCPEYDSGSDIKYSYFLENFSTKWINWSESNHCEFTNLREGVYTFRAKAINVFGKESLIDEFTFEILPPWYRSVYAYIAYVLLFVVTIALLIRLIMLRINVSKRKERLKHLRSYRRKEQQFKTESLIQEKEIIRLRNERLRSKMKHRDKELANQTLNLIQKNRYLLDLKEEIMDFSREVKSQDVKNRIAKLIRSIDKEFDNKKQWELFETAFDEVHEDFLNRLKQNFPNLTPNEIRLSAYLRMNISTKEIASLMNISVRGVEISRYRLRKKMGISREINLTKYIMEL